jgi:hypothetical protein
MGYNLIIIIIVLLVSRVIIILEAEITHDSMVLLGQGYLYNSMLGGLCAIIRT